MNTNDLKKEFRTKSEHERLDKLKDIHWLLLVSKRSCNYSSQRERWNGIQRAFRQSNKGLNAVVDLTGEPLDLYSGVYQD